jgi:hypothetical protein
MDVLNPVPGSGQPNLSGIGGSSLVVVARVFAHRAIRTILHIKAGAEAIERQRDFW